MNQYDICISQKLLTALHKAQDRNRYHVQDSTFKTKLNIIKSSSEFKQVIVSFVGRSASLTSLHAFTSGSKMYIKGLYTLNVGFFVRENSHTKKILTDRLLTAVFSLRSQISCFEKQPFYVSNQC